MKQIKDVEKLKELIAKKDFVFSDTGNVVENIILSIIDSLAVEVPEAKPGVIDALFEIVGYAQDRMSGELKKQFERISGPARAELAQLQADNVALKKTVDEITSLNEKMNDEAIKLQADLKFEEAENKNLKGALRTLATECAENNPGSEMEQAQYWIDHAIANPTEEVEG